MTRLFSVMFLVFGIQASAWGMTGWAEVHTELIYNDFANLHWIHPGDSCDDDRSYCFKIEKKDGAVYSEFHNLKGSFEKINIPADGKTPFVLALRTSEKEWIVYDLKTERLLIQTPERERAFSVWSEQGLPSPVFISATDRSSPLSKTWSSFEREFIETLSFVGIVFAIVLVIPMSTIGLIGGALSGALRWRRSRCLAITALAALLVPGTFVAELMDWGLPTFLEMAVALFATCCVLVVAYLAFSLSYAGAANLRGCYRGKQDTA